MTEKVWAAVRGLGEGRVRGRLHEHSVAAPDAIALKFGRAGSNGLLSGQMGSRLDA
jgi:hypothetical protein